ncbi:tRNA lysidine(34) synthetase TilS, partial [bacterium K02(2017)]
MTSSSSVLFNPQDYFSLNEIEQFSSAKSLLMVSGGPDSIYLFHLFNYLKTHHDINFDVIHFNHNLRGEESDNEQDFVEQLCKQHKITCLTKQLNFETKTDLQNQCRLKRYRYIKELNNKSPYHFVFSAHHQDDQFETLVMKKNRGAGLKGMSGIKRLSHVPELKKVALYRPLLNINKNKIQHFLDTHHLKYCIDSSNLKTDYTRNQIRQEVLPQWNNELSKKRVVKSTYKLQ